MLLKDRLIMLIGFKNIFIWYILVNKAINDIYQKNYVNINRI